MGRPPYPLEERLAMAQESKARLKTRNQNLRKRAMELLDWAHGPIMNIVEGGPNDDFVREYKKWRRGMERLRKGNLLDIDLEETVEEAKAYVEERNAKRN